MLERTLINTAILAAALITPAYASGYQTITTFPSTTVIYQFGVPDSSTYGQTLTVPLGANILDNYTFELQYGSGSSVPFQLYIAQWNGVDAVGAPIYTSQVLDAPSAGAETYTVQTDLSVVSGQQYVVYISTSNEDRSSSGVFYEFGSYAPYTGGGFVYENNGSDTSQWTGGQWSTWPVPESAFTANFSTSNATPAPAAVVPMLTGLALRLRSRRTHGA